MRKRGKGGPRLGGPRLGGLRNPILSARLVYELRMGLHTSYATLASAQPTRVCVEQLSEAIGGMVAALSAPDRHRAYDTDLRFLREGLKSLAELRGELGMRLDAWQILPVLNAVQVCDRLFNHIGVSEYQTGLVAFRMIRDRENRRRAGQ